MDNSQKDHCSVSSVLGELGLILDVKLEPSDDQEECVTSVLNGIETILDRQVPKHIKEFSCDICNFKSKFKQNLWKHNRKYHFEQFVGSENCDFCDFKAVSKSGLKMHKRIQHNGQKTGDVFCKLCDVKSTKEEIYGHYFRHHGKLIEEDKIGSDLAHTAIKKKKKETEYPNTNSFQCTHCRFRGATEGSLKTHLHKQHKDLYPSEAFCDICDYRSTEKGVKIHKYRFHFNYRELQSMNMKQKLPTQKKVKYEQNSCRLCEFSATSNKALVKHYSENHEGTKVHSCSDCDYTTNFKRQLRIHNEAEHLGKSYSCEQCDFKTVWSSYLRIHINSRHLQTPFSCSECEYETKWKVSLNVHEREVHGIRKLEYKKKVHGSKEKMARILQTKQKKECEKENDSKSEENLCSKCGFKTPFAEYLSIHSCQLSQLYKCETCEWTTKSIERFQKHQTRGHEKQYNCDFCSYSAFTCFTFI